MGSTSTATYGHVNLNSTTSVKVKAQVDVNRAVRLSQGPGVPMFPAVPVGHQLGELSPRRGAARAARRPVQRPIAVSRAYISA